MKVSLTHILVHRYKNLLILETQANITLYRFLSITNVGTVVLRVCKSY